MCVERKGFNILKLKQKFRSDRDSMTFDIDLYVDRKGKINYECTIYSYFFDDINVDVVKYEDIGEGELRLVLGIVDEIGDSEDFEILKNDNFLSRL